VGKEERSPKGATTRNYKYCHTLKGVAEMENTYSQCGDSPISDLVLSIEVQGYNKNTIVSTVES
jgi:hypothetical protein